MATDSFVQVAPDSSGKQVDMELVSTSAGSSVYRQRAALVGDVAEVMSQLLAVNQAQLAVLRAILATLNATGNAQVNEEDFYIQG